MKAFEFSIAEVCEQQQASGKAWLDVLTLFGMHGGAIVFVNAGVEHHFDDITEDLTVVVFFAARA